MPHKATPALPGIDDLTAFRALFTAYPDALLVVDAAGDIVLANPHAEALLGYGPGELVGLPVEDLVPASVRARHADYRHGYGENPQPRPMGTQMDLVARRRDGSEVMVEIALSPLQQHGLPFVVAAIRGIGAYPRVRQALQRAHYAEQVAQIGRLAVDSRDATVLLAQVPIVATQALDADICVIFLLEPNGLEFRVAGGVNLLPGEQRGDLLPNRRDTPPGHILSTGRPFVVEDYASETRFVVPTAYIAAGLTCALAVPLSDRGRIVGALTVRSRKRQRFGDDEVRFLDALSSLLTTSLQRAQSEEQLNHSQRLESVGQLTGGIAHDFNNLLTVISGNLQVLEDLPALADDAFGRQMLAAASRATRRAADLTSKLLAFSRRQVLQPSTVDAGALLHALTGMLRRTLDQRIHISVDAPRHGPHCLADLSQLESALLNVAINARDAMPDGGTLAFQCRPCEALPPGLEVEPADGDDDRDGGSAGYVAISVADTGTGMSASIRERAFEPFFTTKEAGRGTGLGLSTVYGFARQSRGAVTIDSLLGVGTTITLYLPRPGVAAADDDIAPESADVPSGTRVLLVEDDAEVRRIAQTFLEALGCSVTPCANAEQALPLLGADTADAVLPFDLLLSDIALGAGMRGTDFAAEAERRVPGLPVLLMSGYSSGVLDRPPPWELMHKPFTRTQLARAIVRVLKAM